jgi:cell division initiation protein
MQRLTPLDIQKQTFRKSLSGYSVDEVRAYLHMIAEELEEQLKEIERLSRENLTLREQIAENSEREQILKETLLSAQRVSEEVKSNSRKEAELIIKDAELFSERIITQAMARVGELEKTILELKLQRKAARNRLNAALDTYQQMVMLDAEQEANEEPITQLHRHLREEK